MRLYMLERELWVPRPVEEVFAYFADAANLEAITPDLLRFRILTPMPMELRVGSRIEYALRWRGIPLRWTTEITDWRPPTGFIDVQLKGPYRLWEHTHRFQAADGGTWVRDVVHYALPAGVLGRILHGLWVGADLKAIFDFRARRVSALLATGRADAIDAVGREEAPGSPPGSMM